MPRPRNARHDPFESVARKPTKSSRAAVRAAFPRLHAIDVFGGRVSGWLKLSSKSPDFEDDVLAACALVRARDPRIGKVPNAKKARRRP